MFAIVLGGSGAKSSGATDDNQIVLAQLDLDVVSADLSRPNVETGGAILFVELDEQIQSIPEILDPIEVVQFVTVSPNWLPAASPQSIGRSRLAPIRGSPV